MQIASNSSFSSQVAVSVGKIPNYAGHPDYDLAKALTKVSPQAQAKTKTIATNFEAMFINSMFSEMTAGLKGDGPFGSTPGTGVWRGMLTDEYSKSFAKAGGIGISHEIFRTLILQQARTGSSS
ncbi:MAG TPA: flagellar assembly peptidoglycan hydrolase FlgJ [Bradyrhizobium sp.]|nr:flagellar assembly peptidoglycan hydrolase FlgJ [Bradyrhizobium sp.]